MSERWIIIPNWERFQHYGNRSPIWIKNYTRLLSNSEYLSLSPRARGILHGIWMLYAASGCELGASPAQLGRMLGLSEVRNRDIQRLVDAGFIEVSASKPLAQNRREKKDITRAFTSIEDPQNNGPVYAIPHDLLKDIQ